ncbi:MAG: hypothetical protein CMM50_03985 [Rhodospirillaceae bacterium]|nr:hypothetical protein [Rhodospirillaceae bacterium]|tara:strand:+ start:196 stop:594 length:399 start_codon:yes stop_codon:yes gene_type:complete
MVLFWGVLLLAAAVLLFGYGLVTFRRPHAPGWVERYAGEVYAVLILVLGIFGVTVTIRGILQAGTGGGDVTTGGAFSLGVVVAAAILWSRLKVKTRLKAYDAVAVMPGRGPAAPRNQPPSAGRSGAGRRKAA